MVYRPRRSEDRDSTRYLPPESRLQDNSHDTAPVRRGRPAWLAWAAGALLGSGPFVAYIASRTVGVPGDPHDVGNWGYWIGTVSLIVEAALVTLSVGMLLALRRHPSSR